MLIWILGIWYLWIDSICIWQDDHGDWERESSRMMSVYTNAYLTINVSKAQDSSAGLFDLLPACEYFEFQHISRGIQGSALAHLVPSGKARTYDYSERHNEPLADRAWAIQERVLSSRSLIYTCNQKMFGCLKGVKTEDDWATNLRFHSTDSKPEGFYESNKVDEEGNTIPKEERDKMLSSWYLMLQAYAGRKLTKASDKLPAVSGLAGILAGRVNDKYAAGHWCSSLVSELLWRPLRRTRIQE